MSGDGAQGESVKGRSVGNGRYELQSLLGQGGMAAVHLAYDTVLDRQVAVKTLHTELGREQSFRERFRREAQAVAKLNHTNIVSVFDSGEDTVDGATVPYIVMEYVEGKPLRQVLDEDIAAHGAMPTEKALKITGDVLAALEASHEMGLVHRDIKPGNVMVTTRGVVKVMDFGIARALQSGVTSMTQTGMVVGTPQYLSPEQALGRGVDARSDLYSVGCMLFELLTGRLPFDGDSPLSIAYQHVQEEPPVPSSINQAIPPAVDALVARALKKNPADRFPTAEAMRDEVDRVRESGRGGPTPLIIGEGPRARGASTGQGVSSAIFPQVQGSVPGPRGNVQTPFQPDGGYTPTAYAPQTAPPGPVGPSTPPPGPLSHQTPMPGPMGPNAPRPVHTPAPGPVGPGPNFTISPQPGPRPPQQQNSGCSTAMIIVGVVLGLLALIITFIIVIAANTDEEPDDRPTSGTTSGSTSSGTSSGTDPEPGTTQSIKPGNPYNTVSTDACTNPTRIGDKIQVPNLMYADIDEVRACMDAAGWTLIEEEENETLYGEGVVVDQDPKYEFVKPGKLTITVWVSTGHE